MPVPRIQRALPVWLDEELPKIRRQVVVQRRTKAALGAAFDVGPPALHGWLSGSEITIAVTVNGECWDLIYDDYALAAPAIGGFAYQACAPDDRRVHSTREALWRAHLFESF